MGLHDDDTAARRLRLLAQHFREHPATGPGDGRSSPATTPAAPVNLRIVDHIDATLREIAGHTRSVNPDAGPLSPRVEGAYAWYRENLKHAPEAEQQRADTIVYRHQLEHAIEMGDHSVIRPHRCPDCGTVGLLWQAAIGRAMCVNLHCANRNRGTHRTWSLARLAYQYVTSKNSLRDCAT